MNKEDPSAFGYLLIAIIIFISMVITWVKYF